MKKHSFASRLTAVALAAILIVAFAMPAFAATAADPNPKATYDAYRVNSADMVLDGKITGKEPWEKVDWTATFGKLASDDIDPEGAAADVAGKAKFLWSYEGEAGAATAAKVYMLLTFTDPDGKYTAHTTSYMSDCVVVGIDETNTYNYSDKAIGKSNAEDSYTHISGSMLTEASTEAKAHKDSTWCTYFVAREGTTVTVELSVDFRGPAAYAKAEHTIKFGVAAYRTVEDADGALKYQKNAWGGLWPNTKNSAGLPTITLKEKLAAELGNQAPEQPGEPEAPPAPDYTVNRVNGKDMVLDGKITGNEPWDKVEWTAPFKNQGGEAIDAEGAAEDVTGKAKFLWSYEGEAGAATAGNVYMLLTFTDPDGVYTPHSTSYMSDCFVVSLDQTNACTGAMGKTNAEDAYARLAATMLTQASSEIIAHKDSTWCSYYVVREGNTVTVEACMTLNGAAEYAKADTVMRLSVALYRTVTKDDGSVVYQKNSWDGIWPNTKSPEKLPTVVLSEAYPDGYVQAPEQPEQPEPPKTSDAVLLLPAMMLAVLSAGGVVLTIRKKHS